MLSPPLRPAQDGQGRDGHPGGLPPPPGTGLGCRAWRKSRLVQCPQTRLCVSTVPPCEASRSTHLPPAHSRAVFPQGGTLFLQPARGAGGTAWAEGARQTPGCLSHHFSVGPGSLPHCL